MIKGFKIIKLRSSEEVEVDESTVDQDLDPNPKTASDHQPASDAVSATNGDDDEDEEDDDEEEEEKVWLSLFWKPNHLVNRCS